jgi:membrane associated rhomboid family serine protease
LHQDRKWQTRYFSYHWIDAFCSLQAVRTFEALRIAAAVTGALAVMSLLAIVLSSAQAKPLVPALVAVGGVLAGVLWARLGPLIQQFYYVPYDHQAMN